MRLARLGIAPLILNEIRGLIVVACVVAGWLHH
jgi:hypothetical protein